ncbi:MULTISPECIES: ABC transporter ATP-binding protein [unclassified Achromobacter]|uniref:ABC transporter ATP-binding protein n=1 Tax=unclassified Achromobacter TaxID=2626865 RepID=UPI000B51A83D|nr:MULTISPECIES: ABC transporter ATP-binding protein [unclassified Achromobacter]OWT80412.1 Fe3+/spermidine/putrescine ABC transporter ATP-binding protein [Achromobacter sp. HZ34]OWT82295.1 Fe3+/spermidine/putrescine ABC transporter ATP-binding protein [Achromobacter sp. HZ28]
MSAINISGLVKRHGDVVAVRGIDLDVEAGELVVLLGPSGCGKTTTLRCLAGLEDATEGEIRIGGVVVSRPGFKLPPEKRSIGMVFQSYALWPHMTVAGNLAFGLRLHGLPKAEIAERLQAALQLVGLGNYASRNAGELSGGQQQRVALARAIVLQPQILLFDEPLSNLDAKMRERMRLEIRELQKRLGITTVYVTHDQQEAMVIADRIVLMNAGRIEQIGPPRQLYDRPASLFAADFVGVTNPLDGRITAVEGGHAIVKVRDAMLECPAQHDCKAGDEVDVVIRPEHIRVGAKQTGERNGFQGQVTDTVFLGSCTDIGVASDIGQIRAQCSPPGNQTPGQTVWLTVDPAAIVLLRRAAAAGNN